MISDQCPHEPDDDAPRRRQPRRVFGPRRAALLLASTSLNVTIRDHAFGFAFVPVNLSLTLGGAHKHKYDSRTARMR